MPGVPSIAAMSAFVELDPSAGLPARIGERGPLAPHVDRVRREARPCSRRVPFSRPFPNPRSATSMKAPQATPNDVRSVRSGRLRAVSEISMPRVEVEQPHSSRSATIGLMRAARRAGKRPGEEARERDGGEREEHGCGGRPTDRARTRSRGASGAPPRARPTPSDHPDVAGERGEDDRLDEHERHDARRRGADRLAEPDLPRALGDRRPT